MEHSNVAETLLNNFWDTLICKMWGKYKTNPICFYTYDSNKKKTDYDAIFKIIIRELGECNNLDSVVVDYEAAVWQSIKECFPTVEIHGCGFHFAQAVFRHVQSLGLVKDYKN